MFNKVVPVLPLRHDRLRLRGDSIDRRFGSQRRRRLHVVKPLSRARAPLGTEEFTGLALDSLPRENHRVGVHPQKGADPTTGPLKVESDTARLVLASCFRRVVSLPWAACFLSLPGSGRFPCGVFLPSFGSFGLFLILGSSGLSGVRRPYWHG